MPRLGAHISVAGGLPRAFARARELDCQAIQIFVKNQHRWLAPALEDSTCSEFRRGRESSSIQYVAAHASYLINLASTDPAVRRRSRTALADELSRCHRLGIDALVLHPGAHKGAGVESALPRVAAAVHEILGELAPCSTRLLFENTAGQGTTLGASLAELAQLLEPLDPADTGICLDTCHAFTAGQAIHRRGGVARWLDQVESTIGIDRLGLLHLNDSKTPFASRRDRHENLGAGEIGAATFERLVREPRLARSPMIIETPQGRSGEGYRQDLELLRRASSVQGGVPHGP